MRVPRRYLAFALTACCDARPAHEAAPSLDVQTSVAVWLAPSHPLQVLFVVDAAPSDAERAAQATVVETIARGLVSGDFDGDGQPEITPHDDVTAMAIPSDPASVRPDTIDEYAFHGSAHDDPNAFAHSLSAAVQRGVPGASSWPQPLEAAYVALTRVCVLPPNTGGLIVYVTTTDDCSLADPDLANPSSTAYSGSQIERCANYPGALQPLERYATLRTDTMGRSVFTVIVGGLDSSRFNTDPQTYSSDASTFVLGVAPRGQSGLGETPACTSTAGTTTYWPLRLTQSAGWAAMASRCDRTWVPELSWLAQMLPTESPRIRFRSPVPPDVASEEAELVEFVPSSGASPCASFENRTATVGADGRAGCIVRRVTGPTDPDGPGWFALRDGPTWERDGFAYLGVTRGFVHPDGASYVLSFERSSE